MVVRGLATAPRLEAVRQLVRGTARRRGWRSAGLYTLCPSLLPAGGEDREDSLHRQHPGLALSQLDMDMT